jgi:hypothetical protein
VPVPTTIEARGREERVVERAQPDETPVRGGEENPLGEGLGDATDAGVDEESRSPASDDEPNPGL